MKRYLLTSVLALLCFTVHAQTWVPQELIVFGSSNTNAIGPNDPIPNEDNLTYPRKLAELLFVEGTNYGCPGCGLTSDQLNLLKNDYLVNGNPIGPGTVHILGPWNNCSSGTCEGAARSDAIADIVEMVEELTAAGAEHIYIVPHPFGGRIAAFYKLAASDPVPDFDTKFANLVAAVDANQAAWGDEVEAAVLAENPDVRRLNYIDFMQEFEADPDKFDILPEDFYLCASGNSCIQDDPPPHGYAGQDVTKNYVKLVFIDGIHLTYRGNNALAHWIAQRMWEDAGAVQCNDGGLSVCGHSVKVRCEGANADDYIGALMIDEAWVGKYLFWDEDDNDGADEDDLVCASLFGAMTNKLSHKCTDVLKGNGKNSPSMTFDIEMKYDASKDDC